MNKISLYVKPIFIGIFVFIVLHPCNAQKLLDKQISVDVHNKRVAEVLDIIGKQGGFYFSYNSKIVNGDSLVTLSVTDKTVKQLMNLMFGSKYQFREEDKYIIILPSGVDNFFFISGYVHDMNSGEKLGYSSVYEPHQLVSAISDEEGYFKIRLKEKAVEVTLVITRVSYADTVVTVSLTDLNSDLQVSLRPVSKELSPVIVKAGVEETWFGKLLLPFKQRMHSLNLRNYFTNQPFQVSLVPGLGTHGILGAQVINKFSVNIIGGYTAGVKGMEFGSLFNFVKKDVQFLQLSGGINVVGGKTRGVQLAGFHNHVFDSVNALQMAGFSNIDKQNVKGVQAAGVYNQVDGNVQGVQVSGLINITKGKSEGFQIAGLINKTKILKGVQIGLINIADSSTGYSIGIVNIIKKGYHKAELSSNEITNTNLSYKSGYKKYYGIVRAGSNISADKKLYSFGYGLGSEIINKKNWQFTVDVTAGYIYAGDWKHISPLYRVESSIHFKLKKNINIFTGPAFSLLSNKQQSTVNGYKTTIDSFGNKFNISSGESNAWIGWQLGISLF